MSIDVGFYFGGSSMSIAYSRDEKLSIIVNEAGYRTTPSVLSLTDNEYLVGVPAKHNIIRNSKNTVLFAKHFIDKSQSTAPKELLQKLDCQVEKLKLTWSSSFYCLFVPLLFGKLSSLKRFQIKVKR